MNRCKGVISIADDVVIHGKDDEVHSWHLCKLMQVADVYGLLLIPERLRINSNSISFFGSTYECGIHFNNTKVSAMHVVPLPQFVIQVQEFLGMVTFLSLFIQSLFSATAMLHELFLKDVAFQWNAFYPILFTSIKALVRTDTTFQYFDVHKPVVIQVNTFKCGLSAALNRMGHQSCLGQKHSPLLNTGICSQLYLLQSNFHHT